MPIKEPHLIPPFLSGLWVVHTRQGAGVQNEGGTPPAGGPVVRLSPPKLRLGKVVTGQPYRGGKGRKRAPYQDWISRTTFGKMEVPYERTLAKMTMGNRKDLLIDDQSIKGTWRN